MQVTENLTKLASAEKGHVRLAYPGPKLLLDPVSLLAQLTPQRSSRASHPYILPAGLSRPVGRQTSLLVASTRVLRQALIGQDGPYGLSQANQCGQEGVICKLTRPGTCGGGKGGGRDAGDWLLGWGKTTEMGVVGHQRAVASLWLPGWETGTLGSTGNPLCYCRCLAGGGGLRFLGFVRSFPQLTAFLFPLSD